MTRTTIDLPFTPEDVRQGTSPRGLHFDRAWKAIVGDDELTQARRKLSIHEMKTLINHVLDAAR
jgi:uncharacterized protein YcbX